KSRPLRPPYQALLNDVIGAYTLTCLDRSFPSKKASATSRGGREELGGLLSGGANRVRLDARAHGTSGNRFDGKRNRRLAARAQRPRAKKPTSDRHPATSGAR